MNSHIPCLDFVAIDFETANKDAASVCQIGVAKVRDGHITKTATHLIKPPVGFTNFADRNVSIHGITWPMVREADGWEAMLGRLIAFTGDLPLVAHSYSVEQRVITQASEASGLPVPDFTYRCSLKLARRAFPNETSHSLGRLTKSLGLEDFNHHDAGEDAAASARLVLHAAHVLGERSVEELWPIGDQRR